jgi:hypothetical protein
MGHSVLLFKCHLILGVWRLWSTLGRRLMRGSVRAILSKTRTYASGKATASITFTIKRAIKIKSIIGLPNQPSNQSSKATMPLFLLMVRLAQVKLTLWKDSNTMGVIHRAVLSPDPWKRSSSLSKCNQTRTSRLWSEQVTSRFTMK